MTLRNLFVFLVMSSFLFGAAELGAASEKAILNKFSKVMKRGDVDEIVEMAEELAEVNTEKTVKKLGQMVANTKDEEIHIAAINGLGECNKELAFKVLVKLVKKVKSPAAREVLFEALVDTANSEFLGKKGVSNSSGLIRGVAYYEMSKDPKTPDEDLEKRIRKEKDPDAMIGLAAFLGSCLEKKVARSLATEKIDEILEGRDTDAKAVALIALATVGGDKILSKLQQNYEHPDWRVRLEICERVAARGTKKDLLFLVSAMYKEDGRLRKDLAMILKKKTGKDHGLSANDWRNEILGKAGSSDGEEVKTSHAKYYGVDIVSKRIIFIFDKTGSMLNPAGKLQTAKDKLCEVLRALDADVKKNAKDKYERMDPSKLTHFTIIAFSDDTVWWKKKMTKATDGNVEAACKWVQSLSAVGPTHADLPLSEAMGFAKGGAGAAGGGKKTPSYMDLSKDVDTIFFVTDGSPYKFEFGQPPAANPRMEEYNKEILAMVKKMNKKLKIVINAAGILPRGQRSSFLERLTKLTGGEVVYVPQ